MFPFHGTRPFWEKSKELNKNKKILWIDKCKHINIGPNFSAYEHKEICILAGRLGEDQPTIIRLADTQKIDGIESHINPKSKISQRFYKRNIEKLSVLNTIRSRFAHQLNITNKQKDSIEVASANSSIPTLDKISHIVVSQGFWEDKSLVFTKSSTINPQVIPMRGLTLVGINGMGAPVKLAHMDTCGHGQKAIDAEAPYTDIQTALASTASVFPVHVILAHDSAVCGENNLRTALQGVPLEKLDEIQFRGPYIAVLNDGQPIFEEVGGEEESLALALTEVPGRGLQTQRRGGGAPLPKVAHAGGGYQDMTYTNFIEALDTNRNAFNLFEIAGR